MSRASEPSLFQFTITIGFWGIMNKRQQQAMIAELVRDDLMSMIIKCWKLEAPELKMFPEFHLSETVRVQNSSISKVEHTKGKFPIKILIKFNPSTQSCVTNCSVWALDQLQLIPPAVPWLIVCRDGQSRPRLSFAPHLILNLCHGGKCSLVHFYH